MSFHLNSHQESFRDSLIEMKKNGVMTDVALVLSDDSSVQCHKVILMASSPFFEKMFQSEMKEGAEKDVKLDFTDADTIRTVVDFFYSGNIQVTEENVKALVKASDFLCCEHLKAYCDAYIADKVRSENYLDLYKFSKLYNLGILLAAAFHFILDHFADFIETSDFDQLTEEELVKIISDDKLNAEKEDIVFEAVAQWVNVELGLRKEAFPRIAPLIRFPFCRMVCLANKICNSQLILDSGCIGFVSEALRSHCDGHSAVYNARFVPRRAYTGKRQHIVRISENQGGVLIEHTDSIDDVDYEWNKNVEWSQIRHSMTVTLGNNVMFSAGFTLGQTLVSPAGIYLFGYSNGKCYLLAAESMKLVSLSVPWQPAKNGSSLAFLDGKIFAFGGKDGGSVESKSVQSFDLKCTNPTWKNVNEMMYAVCNHCVAQFDNKLFVFGGCSQGSASKVTQEFNLVTGKWRRGRDMPGSCSAGSALALNDEIYVIGGKERVCFRYSPARDEWEVLSPPNNEGHSSICWQGKLLLQCNSVLERYDPDTDTWSVQDHLYTDGIRMLYHSIRF